MYGRNNGKKLMAVRVVKHAMEIIHLLTDQNPIQVIVDAIINRWVFIPWVHVMKFRVLHRLVELWCMFSISELKSLFKTAAVWNLDVEFFRGCSGPREDATRIGSAGVIRRQAVDISPLRRVNQAIYLLTTGARESAFRNIKTIAECLADELINAAKGSSNRYDLNYPNYISISVW